MLKIIIIQVIIFNLLYFIFKNVSWFSRFLDNDFKKEQSFHSEPIPRYGGILIFFTFLISVYFNSENIINYYMFVCFMTVNFLLGTLDDVKLIINPLHRFVLFLIINVTLIIFFNVKIREFDVFILDYLNSFIYFSILISFFCLFFIINGSNLIDGFNGLLGIHAFLILGVLSILTYNKIQSDILILNYILMTSLALFLVYNIPKAKIFLGDGGSFFIGTLISLLIIVTYNQSNQISPFYFAILIFYLFFEIFFSVFRKILQGKNPFYPDRKHLHMLVYKYLKLSNNKIKNHNFMTSLIINISYGILITPSFFFYQNDFICKIYFTILILIYLIVYYFLNQKIKIYEKKN